MLVFCTLALPASVMNLSITKSFWSGLNPLAAISMMRIVGLPYLGLCAFSSPFGQPGCAPEWFAAEHAGVADAAGFNFVAMYFTLIMFNMMGCASSTRITTLSGRASVRRRRAMAGRRRPRSRTPSTSDRSRLDRRGT